MITVNKISINKTSIKEMDDPRIIDIGKKK
jgi:hypothetical protein